MHSDQLIKSLYACTAKASSSQYPSLKGLLYDKGTLVASDTWVIAIVNCDYDPEFEGKIIDRKGNTIYEKPLNYKGVIPASDSIERATEQLEVADFIAGCSNVPASPDVDHERILVSLDGISFYPPRLIQILRVFEQLGEQPVTFLKRGSGLYACAVLQSDNCTAVVMAVNSPRVSETYTIIEALEIGDLL